MQGKAISVLLHALGFIACSTAVYAHTPPVDINQLVTIPSLQPGAEFSFTALALQPGANNLNYVIYNKALPTQSPSWTEKEIHPDYQFAYALGGRYVFPNGKDISLTWTHLNSSDSASISAPNDEFFLGPDYEIGPDAIPIHHATGKAEFKYDVINLDAGQFVNFGRNVDIRFFGGISDARLHEDVTSTYTGTLVTPPFAGAFSTEQKVASHVNAIGPRIGVDANYNAGYGFSVLAEAAASALVGSINTKTSYRSSAPELLALFGQDINNQFVKDDSVTQIIPAFDAKLGASFQYTFTNCMIFMLKAGYQTSVYINAINQYLPASLVSGESMSTGGIFVATMNHTQSNFSVQGPFLEATLQV